MEPIHVADIGTMSEAEASRLDRYAQTNEQLAVRRPGAAKVTLFQQPFGEYSVDRVLPGSEIRWHLHNEIWDLFVCTYGQGVVSIATELEGVNGTVEDFSFSPGTFLAIPPKHYHRIVNTGNSNLVFVLVHAPYEGYDNIKPAAANSDS